MVEPILNPKIIHNVTDLLVAALHIDRYIISALDRLDEDFVEINTLALTMFKQISQNKHHLNKIVLVDKVLPNEDVSNHLEAITLYNENMETQFDSPRVKLQRLCTCCDRCFAFYDAIVKSTSDESLMKAAQKLASFALDRHEMLKVALNEQKN